jgi:hypothetical protein
MLLQGNRKETAQNYAETHWDMCLEALGDHLSSIPKRF